MSNGFQRPTGFDSSDSYQRPNGFQRPTGFDNSPKENKSVLINNMKKKALAQIEEIDRHPYTVESMTNRKELTKIVKDCDNMLTMQTEQKVVDRLQKVDLYNMNNSDEFLEYLSSKNSPLNNKNRDLESIQRFINGKKNNSFNYFMYEEANARNNDSLKSVQYTVDPTHSSDAFTISDTGNKPESLASINYRITLRNSNNLNVNDVQAFIQTFQKEAQKRNIYANCKVLFESSDGIVFYVDKNNLLDIVKLLEDLKDVNTYGKEVGNAIKNFGNVQPFSATLDDSSYYGIAMHGYESTNSKLKTTRGGGLIGTFNQYMDLRLENAYNMLLAKYGNDPSKITAEELYNYMMINHQNQMNVQGDIPLWMNNRIYNELGSKKMSL